ncbi:hypothetical protein G9A89_014178 [Geosiphon pyriformis]|nr:hypothetical protein G9A89_014178 [Geosiphon pyriformis]
MAYCSERQKSKVPSFKIVYDQTYNRMIIYFVGEMLSRMEWETRKVKLANITFELLEKKELQLYQTYVDAVWNEEVKKIKEEMIKKLDHFFSLSVPLNFVGHGVGGAYAVLAAFYYQIHCFNNGSPHQKILVTTFGQPRIGDFSFAILLNKLIKVQRITHSNDYVPRSFHPPPRFLHHDREYWIARDECDCLDKIAPLEDGYFYFECRGYRPKWGLTHGENPECNQGTVDDLESWTHVGPYFGVKMGNCDNQT